MTAWLLVSLLCGAVAAAVTPSTSDLWDLSQGTVVTGTSGLRGGFSAGDVFGGVASTFEAGNTVFSDGQPPGFTHYIEWRTAAPVTLDSFALYAVGDGATFSNQREFDRFVLKTKSPGSLTFDLVLCDFTPTHPYTFVDAASQLLLVDNILPVTAQEFRAEFVQFTAGRGFDGPRVIELDAFSSAQTTTISTMPDWDGTSAFAQMGETPDAPATRATWGQTFTMPAGASTLNTFSYWLSDSPVFEPDPLAFAGYLMEWNGTCATGPILYQSQKQIADGMAHGQFRRFDFDVNLQLDPAKAYVFFISNSQYFDGVPSMAFPGGLAFDSHTGGHLVNVDSESNFDLLVQQPWDQVAGWDMVFEATFSAPANQSPVANAGPDQTFNVDNAAQATVTFDGTGSSDPQNDALTYTWSGSFGTATGPTPAVTLGAGAHTITLTVDDGNGHSDSDTVVVTVVEAAASLWHISWGTVVTVTSGIHPGFSATDMFGGTASTLERGNTMFADGKPAGFTHYIEWQTTTPVTLGAFALYAVGDSPTYNNQREFARFVLKAKSLGSATFDLVLYDYTPTHPYTFLDAASLLLIADNIPSVTAQEFRVEFVQFTAGRGYDGPRIIELEGFAPQNQPPVANAGSDQTAAVGNDCQASIMLDGTGSSDSDNDALTFTWTGSFGTATGATPTVTLGTGVHTVTLTVDDGKGGSASDTVLVTVVDATPPTVIAPPGTMASADANGQALIPSVLSGVGAIDNCTPTGNLNLWQSPLPGTAVGLGTHTITVYASDSAGNQGTATTTFTVVDTTAPVIQSLTASPSTLSATGKLVLVTLSAAVTDNTDPAPQTRIVSVTANEPLKAPGAGVKNPDYQITGDLTLYLRAKSSTKAGRVYTITVESVDVAGNRSTATVNVAVASGGGKGR